MAYLRWRRIIEILSLDRPGPGRVLLRRASNHLAPTGPAHWDAEYQRGAYDRLLRSEQRHHHRLLAALIAEASPGIRILDVGCGEGAFWEAIRPFAPSRYLGIDFAPAAIARAGERFAADIAASRAAFAIADGTTFTTDERFDAIVFPECIEYLGDVAAVITHYQGLLRPGGSIGLTMWLGDQPVRRWWRLKELAEIKDEAVVCSAWGGAWIVAHLAPR